MRHISVATSSSDAIFPIHKLFQRSRGLGLFRLTADKLAEMFGFRLHKRMRGQARHRLGTVLRACAKNAVLRMYEKFRYLLAPGSPQ
jgi:hypothetical protein